MATSPDSSNQISVFQKEIKLVENKNNFFILYTIFTERLISTEYISLPMFLLPRQIANWCCLNYETQLASSAVASSVTKTSLGTLSIFSINF